MKIENPKPSVSVAITVFAYKRPKHLRACLSALAQNQEARHLDLRLYVDAPKSDEDRAAHQEVLNVCKDSWCFSNIRIFQHQANKGLFRSLVEGITETLQQYDQVIVIEDDIEASPFLIRYLLEGLSLYRETKRVASIHGYTPPIKQELPETFFLLGADCWGWATWRDRWQLFRHDADAMANEIRQRNLVNEFNLNGNYDYLEMLDARAAGLNNSWAICWHASCFLANKLTLYPGHSLVKNIGLDGSGEHCGPSKVMQSKASAKPVRVEKIDLEVNGDTSTIYCAHFFAGNPFRLNLLRIAKRTKYIIRRLALRGKHSALQLLGPYDTYDEALALSSGYGSEVILEKVKEAIVNVLNKNGVYERDGTIFQERPSNDNLRNLLTKYLDDGDVVVDFGGGLGGTYINNRDLFANVGLYIIAEQKNFVREGLQLADRYQLSVSYVEILSDLSDRPDFFIFSSVLQYIPNAYQVLREAAALTPRLILIDRTAYTSKSPSEQWWIQNELDYYRIPISYPNRPLNFDKILMTLSGYKVIEKWKNIYDPSVPTHGGVLLCRCK